MIAAQGGNSHFRENFQQAFINCFDVIFPGFFVFHFNFALFHHVIDGGKSQVRINNTGTITEQQGEMVDFAGFGCFNN